MSTAQGMAAELLVATYLEKNKYTILARNYRSAWGEIDIIAQHKDIVAFVEVKMRTKNYFDATELITPSKQSKIITTAKHFLADDSYDHKVFRFDVALVDGSNSQVTYIPNAFEEKNH